MLFQNFSHRKFVWVHCMSEAQPYGRDWGCFEVKCMIEHILNFLTSSLDRCSFCGIGVWLHQHHSCTLSWKGLTLLKFWQWKISYFLKKISLRIYSQFFWFQEISLKKVRNRWRYISFWCFCHIKTSCFVDGPSFNSVEWHVE